MRLERGDGRFHYNSEDITLPAMIHCEFSCPVSNAEGKRFNDGEYEMIARWSHDRVPWHKDEIPSGSKEGVIFNSYDGIKINTYSEKIDQN